MRKIRRKSGENEKSRKEYLKKRGRGKVEEKVYKDKGEGEERSKAITQNGNNIYPIDHEPY